MSVSQCDTYVKYKINSWAAVLIADFGVSGQSENFPEFLVKPSWGNHLANSCQSFYQKLLHYKNL